jgi:hypothetical protein
LAGPPPQGQGHHTERRVGLNAPPRQGAARARAGAGPKACNDRSFDRSFDRLNPVIMPIMLTFRSPT